MPLESGVSEIPDLNPAWPTGTDPKSEGDDHLRNIKTAVQGSFPNLAGPNDIGAPLAVGASLAPGDAAQVGQLFSNIADGGTVASNGAKINEFGAGFSVSRVGVGNYRITFTRAALAAEQQIIVAIGEWALSGVTASYSSPTTTTIDVLLENNSGNAQDFDFKFLRYAWL